MIYGNELSDIRITAMLILYNGYSDFVLVVLNSNAKKILGDKHPQTSTLFSFEGKSGDVIAKINMQAMLKLFIISCRCG